MDTNQYLTQVELYDCNGTVSHTLTLELDGTVRIDLANGRTARIDPTTRENLTPHVPLGAMVIDQAAQLRPW